MTKRQSKATLKLICLIGLAFTVPGQCQRNRELETTSFDLVRIGGGLSQISEGNVPLLEPATSAHRLEVD